jgi:hypothetical protein
LAEAGRDRPGKLVGAMIAPIILRGALYKVDAHHPQRVLDFTQCHCLLRYYWTRNVVRNVKLRECNAAVVIWRSFLGENCVVICMQSRKPRTAFPHHPVFAAAGQPCHICSIALLPVI